MRGNVFGVLLLAAALLAGAAAGAATSKINYSQKKYHQIQDKIYEVHHCDFSVNAKVAGDCSALTGDSNFALTVYQVNKARTQVVYSGTLGQLGAVKLGKGKGSVAVSLSPFSGKISWSAKGLTVNLKAKTEKDEGGGVGDYILPIDEDIADPYVVIPSFDGEAQFLFTVGDGPAYFAGDYSGKNKYNPEKGVLPSQTLKLKNGLPR